MTSHPPSGQPSVPPTGPPSGPLSGPSTRPGQTAPPPPPPGPPHDGSGGGGGGGGGAGGGDSGGPGGPGGGTGGGAPNGGGGGPWYRSIPKVASLTAVVVAAVALIVVLTQQGGDQANQGGGAGGGEVFLQNTSASGPDPFTRSTARTGGATLSPPVLPSESGGNANARPVTGSTPGLYGGTHRTASCDVEQQIRFLADEPAKNAAFASVVGVTANEVPGFLRSLTSVQLRVDTRVTNHGFTGGKAAPFQSVLQAGTAVLVDDRGVPRVRCACGNPLTAPQAQKSPKQVGQAWPGYRTSNVVYVQPSVTVINVFVIYDPNTDRWIARKPGDSGRHDQHTTAPVRPTPTPSTSPSSPVPCVTVTGTETPTPVNGVTPSPCPSTLTPTSPTPSPSTSSPTPSDTTPSTTTPSTQSSGPGPSSSSASASTSASASASASASMSPSASLGTPGSPGTA
ncbi:DUF6777 domain-containing protein [Streptomyces sp. NPDC048623]|uniref:DUF6777 domain-containing protein n=1 Tax=Streptomyces sp. NPDC048623 TaxID=3155761 RepID=UPI003416D8C1